MANIRKTFNFREGVKVDDSVLVVAGQRVGIGSTIPSKVLDINGDVISSGHVEVSNFKVTGISTFGDVKVGSGITIESSSGIITANKYFGDGSTLDNLPTSQWVDTDVGLGFTSIYAQGNVGVGTTDPRFSFQVGSNPDTVGKKGVGINNLTGDIKTTGIITAASFVGDGSLLENLPASAIGGTVALAEVAGFAQTAGIATVAEGLTGIPDIHVGYVTATSANYSGVVTATTFVGALTGNASSSSETSALKQDLDYTMGSNKVFSAGIGSFSSVGIGTTEPQSDIQIVKSNGSEIVFGRDNTSTGNNGSLKFGKVNGAFPYSGETSLDILNYGRGNLNFYVTAGNVGVETGNFYWHRGTISRLMTLTYEGKLGIGRTLPDNTLHVVGTSTVTSNAFFGNNVEITGDATIEGALTAGSFNVGEFTGNLIGNVYAATGVSTFNNLKVVGTSTLNGEVGIGTEVTIGNALSLNSLDIHRVFVTSSGVIGIKTTETFDNITINALTSSVVFSNIGIGSTNPEVSPVNFSDAGKIGVTTTNRFMLPPKITGAERSNIASVVDGALIYNTDNNRIEVWNGTSWQPASAGGVSGISAVVEDVTPQLGGNLDANSKNISNAVSITASTFFGNLQGNVTGSGANLTNLPAGQLTGTVADARISTLTASKLTGALPAIDGSALLGVISGVGIQTVGGNVGYGVTLLDFRGSAIGEITPPHSGISTINITGGSGGGISLTDLSVTTAGSPSQLGALAYNNTNGVFTFTPPDIVGQARPGFSVGTPNNPLQVGAISYNSSSGEFKYTPPDLSSYQQKTGDGSALTGIVTSIVAGTNVTVSNTGGTYTINSSGGGGGGITIQDEGSALSTAATTLNFVGAGVIASGTGATKTITISGGGGTVSSGNFTAIVNTPSSIDTYAYDSAELVFEYTVFVKNNTNYQTQKLLVMRDGTTVTSTQYAVMYSNTLLVQLDAIISGSNLLLRATPESGVTGTTTYRIKREVT